MRRRQEEYAEGRRDWAAVAQSVRAWIAHAAFGDTFVLREQRLGQFTFQRGARPERAGRRFQQ